MKETRTNLTDAAKGGENDEKSSEYLAFEAFAKRVLSVSKEELDRREKASVELADGSNARPKSTTRGHGQ